MTIQTRRRVFLAALAMLCALVSGAALAQNDNTQLRTVHGVVVDKDDNPVGTATVYLVNGKTQAVKSLFTDDKGAYHFSGLDPNVDYELHAERANMTSPTRKISSYESRRDIDMTLKLSQEKHGS
jgi:hypothetical protein